MIHEIEAKKLLITNPHPSYWFGVKYYLNIYRGCMHGCIYCDTRSECYNIDNFDTDISVKTNAIELLKKELSSKRSKETIGFGSASDPYVQIEKKYELTKQALNVVKDFRFPLFLLTKSNLVIRDAEILRQINKQNYACVAFTITTADDNLAKIIEPHAPLPSQRFQAMSILACSRGKSWCFGNAYSSFHNRYRRKYNKHCEASEFTRCQFRLLLFWCYTKRQTKKIFL